MDGIQPNSSKNNTNTNSSIFAPVLVVATSENPKIIDTALRRSGRFDYEFWFTGSGDIEEEEEALKKRKYSINENCNIKWTDIGGLEETKKLLQSSIEWPLKYPKQFKKMNLKPPSGILLYGPPGCCKVCCIFDLK